MRSCRAHTYIYIYIYTATSVNLPQPKEEQHSDGTWIYGKTESGSHISLMIERDREQPTGDDATTQLTAGAQHMGWTGVCVRVCMHGYVADAPFSLCVWPLCAHISRRTAARASPFQRPRDRTIAQMFIVCMAAVHNLRARAPCLLNRI